MGSMNVLDDACNKYERIVRLGQARDRLWVECQEAYEFWAACVRARWETKGALMRYEEARAAYERESEQLQLALLAD